MLDDTGLYLATRGSGGKHVRIYIQSQTENPLLPASFDFFFKFYRQVDRMRLSTVTLRRMFSTLLDSLGWNPMSAIFSRF